MKLVLIALLLLTIYCYGNDTEEDVDTKENELKCEVMCQYKKGAVGYSFSEFGTCYCLVDNSKDEERKQEYREWENSLKTEETDFVTPNSLDDKEKDE